MSDVAGWDGAKRIEGGEEVREADLVVMRDGTVSAVKRLPSGRAGAAEGTLDIDALESRDFFVVPPEATAALVIERLRGSRSMVGVVVGRDGGVLGLITKDSVVDTWADSNDIFPR